MLRQVRDHDPLALFLDFDGTLVDIAPTPGAIAVPQDLSARLEVLARGLDDALALVSGRALSDLERHLGTLNIARAGSHGIDRRLADGRQLGNAAQAIPAAAAAEMAEFAAQHGLHLETKPHGTALHYRAVPDAEGASLQFAARHAHLHGLAMKRGKCVIELVLPGADKGGAVRAFMAEAPFAGRVPIFVGDDVTDEDGFLAAAALGGFGIIVGDRQETAARWRIADPAGVLEWLEI